MSATGLDVFDKTVQVTDIRLIETRDGLGQSARVRDVLPNGVQALWLGSVGT